MTVSQFQIHVPDDVLADLRARLRRTLFTSASDSAYWTAGTDPGYLRELVGYWADGFDWRKAETALNAFPQYTAEVAGRRVHFVHLRARRRPGSTQNTSTTDPTSSTGYTNHAHTTNPTPTTDSTYATNPTYTTGSTQTSGGAGAAGGSRAPVGSGAPGGIEAVGGAGAVGGSRAPVGSGAPGEIEAVGGSRALGGSGAPGGIEAVGGAGAVGGSRALGGSRAPGGIEAVGGTEVPGGSQALGGSRVAGPLPLVLSHGWPSSFVEMLRVAPLLADPPDADDAFDVVIPSLPGFLYSELPQGPWTRQAVARVWHELMTQTLGYSRYGAFGGDIGGGVTQWLGSLYPGQVAGIHLTSAPVADPTPENPATPEEQAFEEALQAYDLTDQGYSEIMWTRPDTIAAALADSPAGLAAWIVDKYKDWSDCGGDVSRRWDRDTLLTVCTLYWATGCIGSSFRSYYDYAQNLLPQPIVVPTAVTLSNEPTFAGFPRSLTERRCTDLRHFSTPERGGHFMAHEEPEQVARELREFFRPLRG